MVTVDRPRVKISDTQVGLLVDILRIQWKEQSLVDRVNALAKALQSSSDQVSQTANRNTRELAEKHQQAREELAKVRELKAAFHRTHVLKQQATQIPILAKA